MAEGEKRFSDEQIAVWTAEGHWPPPKGMTILQEIQPDPEKVKELMNNLLNSLSPGQRRTIEEGLAKLSKTPRTP